MDVVIVITFGDELGRAHGIQQEEFTMIAICHFLTPRVAPPGGWARSVLPTGRNS